MRKNRFNVENIKIKTLQLPHYLFSDSLKQKSNKTQTWDMYTEYFQPAPTWRNTSASQPAEICVMRCGVLVMVYFMAKCEFGALGQEARRIGWHMTMNKQPRYMGQQTTRWSHDSTLTELNYSSKAYTQTYTYVIWVRFWRFCVTAIYMRALRRQKQRRRLDARLASRRTRW